MSFLFINQELNNQQQSSSSKGPNTSKLKNVGDFIWSKLTRPRGSSAKSLTISDATNSNEASELCEKKQKRLFGFFERFNKLY